MKNSVVKRIAVVVFAVTMFFVMACNAYAETIQDRLEKELQALVDKYNDADSSTQQSIQDRFNAFLEENGLQDIDLGNLGETDFAKIIGDLGNNLAFEDFLGLAQEAWASGTDMIKDVIGGGSGTSSGANTATPNTAQTQPTNVIVAIPNYTPSVTTSAVQTTEPTTYNVGETTAPGIVGAGVTAGNAAVTGAIVADDSGMSSSSVVVLIILSVATIVVIVAIVIFFVMKRK